MRRLLVGAVLAVAVAVALLLADMTAEPRADRESIDTGPVRTARTRTEEGSADTVANDRADAAGAPMDTGPRRRRLVYDDGEPAAGITVYCASGRKFVTKIFRNGDYPQKTIWMITDQRSAETDSDGAFTLPPPPGATDAVFHTDMDSRAVLMEPFDAGLTGYRAVRRVRVSGRLRANDGSVGEFVWLSAQLGRPEDYDTRNYHEDPSFVAARGGLEIDPNGKRETEADREGRFRLLLAPGLNTLSFGESGNDGSLPIMVPAGGELDLGEILQPAASAAPRSAVPRELHGIVNSLAGEPLAGAVVRLWDGNVGEPTCEVRTDKSGSWRATRLHAYRVIAWAVSSSQHHMVLPEQSSGTIHMPCNTPVSLVAPAADEYAWVRVPDPRGFYLFERAGVLLGGGLLDSHDAIGLPLGSYRIFAVTDRGILEYSKDFRTGGSHQLD